MTEAFGSKHSNSDPFNLYSEYIVVYCNDDIAAIGRLTKCPNGVFHSWTGGSTNFSNTADTLDLGRCLVTPNYRGGLFYDLLITYCFKYAFENGFKFINGSTVINRKMVDRLLQYGFVKSGNPIKAIEPDENEYELQAYVADLEKSQGQWNDILLNCIQEFEKKLFKVITPLTY
ncbi:MAG: hypothetical protein QM763_12780 [Agriterribacter sp.]